MGKKFSRKFGESEANRQARIAYGFNVRSQERDMHIKHMFYNWDQEMEIIRNMQKCQRNWDYSEPVHPETIDFLLWHAENSPSKQHEAYYDVYWTADRKVIEECSLINAATIKKAELDKSLGTTISLDLSSFLPFILIIFFFFIFYCFYFCPKCFEHYFSVISSIIILNNFSNSICI